MSVDIVREHLEMAVVEARRRQGEIDLLRQQLAGAIEALERIAVIEDNHPGTKPLYQLRKVVGVARRALDVLEEVRRAVG